MVSSSFWLISPSVTHVEPSQHPQWNSQIQIYVHAVKIRGTDSVKYRWPVFFPSRSGFFLEWKQAHTAYNGDTFAGLKGATRALTMTFSVRGMQLISRLDSRSRNKRKIVENVYCCLPSRCFVNITYATASVGTGLKLHSFACWSASLEKTHGKVHSKERTKLIAFSIVRERECQSTNFISLFYFGISIWTNFTVQRHQERAVSLALVCSGIQNRTGYIFFYHYQT